jgi:hypothetical protein
MWFVASFCIRFDRSGFMGCSRVGLVPLRARA